MWMSQSSAPRNPRSADAGTSPASGSPGPGQVSWTWTRIRPDAAQIRAVTGVAVPPGVADRLGHADLQALQDRAGNLAVADAGNRAPGLGRQRVGHLQGGADRSSGCGSDGNGWKSPGSWYRPLSWIWPEGSTMRGWVRPAMSRTRGAAVVASYRHRLHTGNWSQTVLAAHS